MTKDSPTSNPRDAFERWAQDNIGQFSNAGFHGTLGRWVYNHNFVDMCWRCWQAARAADETAAAPECGVEFDGLTCILDAGHEGSHMNADGVYEDPDNAIEGIEPIRATARLVQWHAELLEAAQFAFSKIPEDEGEARMKLRAALRLPSKTNEGRQDG
jgi:hypothetical protein